MSEDLTSGKHSPGETAYFHQLKELVSEMRSAGVSNVFLIAVEGVANMLETSEIFENPYRKELLLKYVRETESNVDLIGMSGHYIAIGKKV